MINTVWAPTTVTEAETFIWYRPEQEPRAQVGLAYLWKQSAIRFLGTFQILPETETRPDLEVGFGVQGIGTGNPGYFATSEKNFHLEPGMLNVYLGVGFRSNEAHGHMLGGAKFSPHNEPWTLGVQNDGHNVHPFVTRAMGGGITVGAYLVNMKTPGLLVSYGW